MNRGFSDCFRRSLRRAEADGREARVGLFRHAGKHETASVGRNSAAAGVVVHTGLISSTADRDFGA